VQNAIGQNHRSRFDPGDAIGQNHRSRFDPGDDDPGQTLAAAATADEFVEYGQTDAMVSTRCFNMLDFVCFDPAPHGHASDPTGLGGFRNGQKSLV
jgi:hypothetical protein